MCNRDKWSCSKSDFLQRTVQVSKCSRQWHNCRGAKHTMVVLNPHPSKGLSKILIAPWPFFEGSEEEWKYLWLYEALTENIMMDDVKMTLSIKSKYRMSSWDNCCDDVGAINTSPSQLLLWYRARVNQKGGHGAVKENAAGKVSREALMLVFGCSSRQSCRVAAERHRQYTTHTARVLHPRATAQWWKNHQKSLKTILVQVSSKKSEFWGTLS